MGDREREIHKRGTETSILINCGGKSDFYVGWLPKDVLPLSVLINLYDEKQGERNF